ncbi:DUF1015 family protein [Nonomuraea rhodomycinica]|uniref:DUF1015 family protein n=1 Tax=Nonomuraea rhodomycinica TaxID=1712872 RepID=A0A7Y6IPE4_9ACTN|nr:DUF1015 family protein [Nonomuraea rhodomycinica]
MIADGHHRYATYRVLQRQEHTARAQASAPQAAPARLASAEEPSPEASQDRADGSAPPTPARPDGSAPPSPARADGSAPPTPSRPDGSAPDADDSSAPIASPDAPQTHEAAADNAASTHVEGQAEAGRPPSGPWDFGLALLVDATAYPPDLKAIHRVIPALPLAEAVSKARGSWRVQECPDLAEGLAALEAAPGLAFLVAGEGGAHLLTDPDPMQLARAMPADRSDRWNALNTSILTEFLMPKVWGVRDDEQSVRIVHHDAHAAVEQAVQTGGTAVILKPLLVAEVLAVAASGERVPRKSTSFGPKPRTGLVLRTFATG